MEFRDSYRMEAIYFQTLKEEISRVKALMASGNTEQAKTLLENAVNVDGAVLLLYRNLGELWGELGAKIEEAKKELEKLDSRVDDYHRELNEKIDDVNNTIIRIINALEERVTTLETTVADHETRIENLEETAADHETRIGNLEETVADHETRIGNIEETISDQETRVGSLETEIVNKITAPISPATGAFLVYDGTEWVAQTLATWTGGNY